MNINDICDTNNVDEKPKRRGRPPKNANIKKKTCNFAEKNDDLILRIPLHSKDISLSDDDDDDNSINDINAFTIGNNIVKDKNNVKTFTEMSDDELECNKSKKQDKNTIIKNLRTEIEKLKEIINNTYDNSISYTDFKITLIENDSNKKINVEPTNIACWWCTHEFDNLPCFIPEKYFDNKYYVFGNFCSFSCAGSYNISLGDCKRWERHSLINKIYSEVTNTNKNINMAPPKEILTRYGGKMSIDEFRRNSKIPQKEYRLLYPMFETVPVITEENIRDSSTDKSTNKNNYKLKRSKPLPSKSTSILKTNK